MSDVLWRPGGQGGGYGGYGQVGEFVEVDLVLVDAEEVGELPAGHARGQEPALDDVGALDRLAAPLGPSRRGGRLDIGEVTGGCGCRR